MPGLGMADKLQYVQYGIYKNEYGILHTRGEKCVEDKTETDMVGI